MAPAMSISQSALPASQICNPQIYGVNDLWHTHDRYEQPAYRTGDRRLLRELSERAHLKFPDTFNERRAGLQQRYLESHTLAHHP